MELLMMIDAARRASAHYVTAVIPYFGLARQDRKTTTCGHSGKAGCQLVGSGRHQPHHDNGLTRSADSGLF